MLPLSAVAIGCLLYAALTRPHDLPYDAGQYWSLGAMFDAVGGAEFSLYNFPANHRGYVFPLICYAIQRVGAVVLGAKAILAVFNAACMALLHVVLAPALWKQMTGVAPRSSRVWLAAVIGCVVWRGYVVYPLSDLPALTMFVASLVCLHRQRVASRTHARVSWAAAVGGLSGLVVLVRPAYLLAACAVVILAAVVGRGIAMKARLSCTAGVLVALLVAVGPQMALNHHHAGSWSPLPRSEAVFGGGGLYLKQLNWGLTLQRYESDVTPGRRRNDIRFIDPVGTRLLAESGVGELTSFTEYARFALRHPLDVLAIYLRHAFNGCDLWYATPYVANPRRLHGGTMLLNLLVWTLACLHGRCRLSWPGVRRSLPHSLLLLMPVAMVIPVAVETRFFWPAHLLAASIACYATGGAADLLLEVRRHWLLLVTFLGVWVTLSRSTYAAMPL
ncbi:MAG: hypothetical protein ABW252_20875 [Polyangiales bacterium]